MIQLRKLHLVIGFTLVPFILVTAASGFIILTTGNYQLIRLHSWFKWGGMALGLGLLFLAISGGILYSTMRMQQWKRKRAPAAKAGI
jgi:hypothetical protein